MTMFSNLARRSVLVLLLWRLAALLQAQEIEAPIEVQYALLHKILAFDRNLKNRVGEELIIGILFQSNVRSSLIFKDELIAVIEKAQSEKLVDLPVRCVAIEMAAELDLSGYASQNKIDVFYVAPLRAVEIKSVTAVSRAKRIFTFTGVPGYVEAGVAVGIGSKGESPRILINLSAARAEGVEFNSQLLKLAKVIE